MVLSIHCDSNLEMGWNWLGDLAPSVVALMALFFSFYQLWLNSKLKKKEIRRGEIYKKLNEFYGPFAHLRKKSDILYNKFQEDYRKKDPHFSTLRYLLKGHKFSPNENSLLEEIIKIGAECESLIYEKSGLIDDEILSKDLIPKASTHYLLLRLAYNGGLNGDITKYADSTFPIQIDVELARRKRELEHELKMLSKT